MNLLDLQSLYNSGVYNYSQYTGQSAIQQFQIGLQQAQQQAQLAQNAIDKANLDAAKAQQIYQLQRLDAIDSLDQLAKTTRQTLQYQNDVADRNISILKNNLTGLQLAQVNNQRIFDTIAQDRLGAVTAQNVGGAISSTGTAADLKRQVLEQTNKDAAKQYKSDLQGIKQTQEQVYATILAKAFNTMNVENQINFSLEQVKKGS